MNKIKLFAAFIAGLIITVKACPQTFNWSSMEKTQKNIININAGAEYGLTFGAGYGYQLRSKLPVVLTIDYSFPSGSNLSDDFKTKIGGTVRLYEINNFHFSVRLQGVFRRYQNQFVTMKNFGSDMSGVIGYYRSKWFAAGEAGFDKAIVTHFKHSEAYRKNYPGVQDGWYEPSVGGNFYYGIQSGFSVKRNDIYVRAGKIVSQDFSAKPLLPYYLQLGCNFRF